MLIEPYEKCPTSIRHIQVESYLIKKTEIEEQTSVYFF